MESRLLQAALGPTVARAERVKRVAAPALIALEGHCDPNKQDDAEDASLRLAMRTSLVAALTTLMNEYVCGGMMPPRSTPAAIAPAAAAPSATAPVAIAPAATTPVAKPLTACTSNKAPQPPALTAKPSEQTWSTVVRRQPKPTPSSPKPRANADSTKRGASTQATRTEARPTRAEQRDTRPRGSHSPHKGTSNAPKARVDDRILVRLADDSPMRDQDAWPLTNKLRLVNSQITTNLHSIARTKTGFAITPRGRDGRAILMSQSEVIKKFFGAGAEFEFAQASDSLAVGPIRRWIRAGSTREEVSPKLIEMSFQEATGITPLHVAFVDGCEHGNSAEVTFVVDIPATGRRPPTSIRMGPYQVPAKLLPREQKRPQCTNCYDWHKEEECPRAPHCRLCGSTTHETLHHTSCCEEAHHCPDECLHCGGPHPADAAECPLRPRRGAPPINAAERRAIRHTQAARRGKVQRRECTPALEALASRANERTPEVEMDLDSTPTQEAETVPPLEQPATQAAEPPAESTAIEVPVADTEVAAEPAAAHVVAADTPIPPVGSKNRIAKVTKKPKVTDARRAVVAQAIADLDTGTGSQGPLTLSGDTMDMVDSDGEEL